MSVRAPKQRKVLPGMTNDKTDKILRGKSFSPGLGEGKVFIYRDMLTRLDVFYSIDDTQITGELKELDRAIEKISDDLSVLANRVEKEISSELSEVFYAHLTMVQDSGIRQEVEKEITEKLVSAGSAVRTVFQRWERRFQSMEAEIAKQKSDDMNDLARRLISALAGVQGHALEGIPRGSVLVAHRLLPSDTVFLSRDTASAALLEVGGSTSHAALFAREIGLPCVAELAGLLDTVSESSFAIVDANRGKVILDPTPKQLEAFRARKQHITVASEQARSLTHEPAITQKGVQIRVLANVGDAEDTQVAVDNGADGVGLYRLEHVYLGRQIPPSVNELVEEMQMTLQPAKGLPVYVRLLDVGADKPLPFFETKRENNPSLGVRGIRFLLEHPDLLHNQLDALLELSSNHDLHILIPMVTLPRDVSAVRTALEEAMSRTKTSHRPQLGAMIETPSAALAAAEIMEYADFLSVGTNDLTQYTFAADRENAAVGAYFDDTHDILFRLIRILHEDVPNACLSVCGELAGRTHVISKLVECPEVKEAVRRSSPAS